MTDVYAASFEFNAPQKVMVQMPEPRSPEEVLQMLAQEPPPGEYSVDAF